ncbi:hypothetical protein ACFYVL_40585 [Streptomyces sp. NPDC004111]|uniref:hypothetical protein n=1 Tax=Streptomyces sp. NPDC004111 TaxID=3364690 RepID=UPI00368A55B5
MASTEVTLSVEYGQFLILDTNATPDADDPVNGAFANGLAGVGAGGRCATVLTGTGFGTVPATLETAGTAPAPPASGWQDIVELSMFLPDWGPILLSPDTGEGCEFPLVDHSAPPPALDTLNGEEWEAANASHCHWWRLRIHAQGRDTAHASEPHERYLIQAWPAPPTPLAALKLTDAHGTRLRGKNAQAPADD